MKPPAGFVLGFGRGEADRRLDAALRVLNELECFTGSLYVEPPPGLLESIPEVKLSLLNLAGFRGRQFPSEGAAFREIERLIAPFDRVWAGAVPGEQVIVFSAEVTS